MRSLRSRRTPLAVAAALAAGVPLVLVSGAAQAAPAEKAAAAVVASTPVAHHLPGTTCTAFPASNYWHADISKLPVDPRSATWLSHMSPSSKLHPDFGPSYGAQPVPYGIPITYVSGTHAKVSVVFGYSDESDHVKYPLGSDTKIEGGANATGDRHAIIVDKSTCKLYELWNAKKSSSGVWHAGSGAVWSLTSNKLRPAGWTSADAAGLPIMPGLLRWDEVKYNRIDHAIRFTTDITSTHYLWPARHEAGSTSSWAYPPMGARFRLKASYPISGYSAQAQEILKAMKKYGLVLADNGSPWYFQGTQDTHWPSALLDQLKKIPASAFQAVDTSSLMASSSSGGVAG
ncbi:MAG TPA: hypothetical protein VMI11_13005 [Actinomycetes bacterium]|nr:hypothetical protein [Actinomycetes bacterium]